MRIACTIAVSLFASSALGSEESPPPSPPVAQAAALPPIATPTWSLGAGLSFFASGVSGGIAATTPNGLAPLTTPVTPSVSVERLFSPRFALGLGLEASVQSISVNQGSVTSLLTGTIGFGVSPRFILTSADAPVSFTLFSTLFAGYNAGVPSALGNSVVFSNALSVGVGGGIALELRLLERLSLRVQANLARLSLSTSTTASGLIGFSQVVVGASFIPSPSIELRLYL